MNAKAGSLPLPEIDIEEFRKVVRTRRSIRRFTDEPIPEGPGPEVDDHHVDFSKLYGA